MAVAEKIAGFTTGSRFSFGVVVVLVGLTGYIVGGDNANAKEIVKVWAALERVGDKMEAVQRDLGEVKSEMKDQWRRSDMIDLWEGLGEDNPQLRLRKIRRG